MLNVTETPTAPWGELALGCVDTAVSTHLAVSPEIIDAISEVVSRSSVDLFDLRRRPLAEVSRALHWMRGEAFARMKAYRVPGRAPYAPFVLIVSGSALDDREAAAAAATIVSQARFLGVHLWVEKSSEIARAVDVNTNTGSCAHCSARRIAGGEVL